MELNFTWRDPSGCENWLFICGCCAYRVNRSTGRQTRVERRGGKGVDGITGSVGVGTAPSGADGRPPSGLEGAGPF